jgi:hypothetical protein
MMHRTATARTEMLENPRSFRLGGNENRPAVVMADPLAGKSNRFTWTRLRALGGNIKGIPITTDNTDWHGWKGENWKEAHFFAFSVVPRNGNQLPILGLSLCPVPP